MQNKKFLQLAGRMKNLLLICVTTASLLACNNNASKTETTDSTTSPGTGDQTGTGNQTDRDSSAGQQDSRTTTTATDSAAKQFLTEAADGGLAEVKAGEVAQNKGSDEGVKRFASMMVQDHTGANGEVKRLSQERNISLPSEPSAKHKQKMDEVGRKNGKDFDKAYMDLMVADHKKTISLFEQAATKTQDNNVKSFITATLPKLKMHLDSATAIRNKLR